MSGTERPSNGYDKKDSGRALSVEHVSFAYDAELVLKDINLTVAEGEFIAVLGPSGCGKTSLLRLLAGLEKPVDGKILHQGNPVTGPSIKRGVVFQDYSLFPWLNLQDNLTIAINKARKGLGRAERNKIAEEYLDLVGLQGMASKHPYEVSGGMRQRAAMLDPWLLDRQCCSWMSHSVHWIRSTGSGCRIFCYSFAEATLLAEQLFLSLMMSRKRFILVIEWLYWEQLLVV